jgi:hypothetical protein
MPEVAICTENVVIPTLGIGILFQGERLVCPPEIFVQHVPVCLPLLMQPVLRNIAVLDRSGQERDHYDGVRSGYLADLRR